MRLFTLPEGRTGTIRKHCEQKLNEDIESLCDELYNDLVNNSTGGLAAELKHAKEAYLEAREKAKEEALAKGESAVLAVYDQDKKWFNRMIAAVLIS